MAEHDSRIAHKGCLEPAGSNQIIFPYITSYAHQYNRIERHGGQTIARATCQRKGMIMGVGGWARSHHILHSIHISQILHVLFRSFFIFHVSWIDVDAINVWRRLTFDALPGCLLSKPCLCICIRSNAQQFKMWFSLIYKRHIALTRTITSRPRRGPQMGFLTLHSTLHFTLLGRRTRPHPVWHTFA